MTFLDKGLLESGITYHFVIPVETQYPSRPRLISRSRMNVRVHLPVRNRKSRFVLYLMSSFCIYFFGVQVDIDQSIQFIHHDVDVIRTNSGRDNRQAVSLVISGDGTELPVAFLDVYFLEIRGNHFYWKGHPRGSLVLPDLRDEGGGERYSRQRS